MGSREEKRANIEGNEEMGMKRYIVFLTIILAIGLCGCGQKNAPKVEEAASVSEMAEGVEERADDLSGLEKTGKDVETDKKTEPDKKAKADNNAGAGKNTNADEKAEKGQKADSDQKTAGKADNSSVKEKTDVKTKPEESEEGILSEYKVTAFEETRVMYASNPVNVRKGPSTDYDRAGSLIRAQEVIVSGQADTGWFEIIYGEGKAYVSDRYLQEEKPAEEMQEAAAGQQGKAVTEVKNVSGVILVGDSRFVQMQENAGENSCTWIAENGKGYNWLNENAIARIDSCTGKGSKILINLGVNDPGNLKNYLELVNAKAAEWVGKGAKVYYASVNPVWENPYVTEEQVEYFNSQMVSGLSGNVQWIDSHSYLDSIGYKLVDGLHYNAETYQNLYAYFMSCL